MDANKENHNKNSSCNSNMPFSFLPKRETAASSTEEEESNWNEEDDKALEELRRALREYYNGENISERSTKLATLKMFGSWDDEDVDPQNWQDPDVKAWREFCSDMSCFDDEQTRNRNRMYEEAEEEIANTKKNQPIGTSIWPVTIIRNNVKIQDDNTIPSKKNKKNIKKTTHVDVVFVEEDKYNCTHGIEVLATPKDRIRDVYAGQSLAKFWFIYDTYSISFSCGPFDKLIKQGWNENCPTELTWTPEK